MFCKWSTSGFDNLREIALACFALYIRIYHIICHGAWQSTTSLMTRINSHINTKLKVSDTTAECQGDEMTKCRYKTWYCNLGISDTTAKCQGDEMTKCRYKTWYCNLGISDTTAKCQGDEMTKCRYKTWYCNLGISDTTAECQGDKMTKCRYKTWYCNLMTPFKS